MNPYYEDELVTLYHGDCFRVTEWCEADVLVTDPPYGRNWRRGDTNKSRGWAVDSHEGIAGDRDTSARDSALTMWNNHAMWDRPALVFGDLLLPPPDAKQALVYDKGPAAGFTGAISGYRRNVEGIYLIGKGWTSGLGGRSSIVSRGNAAPWVGRETGHPHTKPLDVMDFLISTCPAGMIADPFAGSGSTLVAAKLNGRHAIGVEVEERYCEVTARRLSQGVLDLIYEAAGRPAPESPAAAAASGSTPPSGTTTPNETGDTT